MGKDERYNYVVRLFTLLMRHTTSIKFSFPKGRLAQGKVEACLDALCKEFPDIGYERLANYCICQVARMAEFDKSYIHKWNISHSFGAKALQEFAKTNRRKIYHEDIWLKKFNLSRSQVCLLYQDISKHPHSQFVYPEYEDRTKLRMLSTDVGYYICGTSTLLWTPFSPVCTKCSKTSICKVRTEKLYPELYRLRVENFNDKRD